MPSLKLLPVQSQPFLDNLQISFCIDINKDSRFRDLKESQRKLIQELFKDVCRYYTAENWNELIVNVKNSHLKNHLHTTLNFWEHLKNSIHIKADLRHYSINIQFHGSYFINTKVWYDDFQTVLPAVKRSRRMIQKKLIQYFGKKSPLIQTKLTRIDIAQNHYRGQIWDWEKQLFCRKDLHIAPQRTNGVFNAVYVGQYGSKYMYFRAYDKRFQGLKERRKAVMRFDTDDFCRNEWSLGNKWLKTNFTNDFYKLAEYCKYKNRSEFIQFFLHKLRKVRDFTYYEKANHKYNIIHRDGLFRKWKRPDHWEKVNITDWKADGQITGMLREYESDLKVSTYIEMIQYARANTGLIPEDIYSKLIQHWKNKDLINLKYSFSNIG